MQKKSAPSRKKAAAPKKTSAKSKYAAKKSARPPKKGEMASGIKKQFLKSKPLCKVTFRLPSEAAHGALSASLVGEFNDWVAGATPMKRLRDGSFTAVVELEQGRDYRFRYLLDGGLWENDWWADRYAPNSFGGEDSVVIC